MQPEKRNLVRSWLTKALHDLMAARTLSAEREFLDTAIYHCQQCAEKAVKGFLVCCDQSFKKTHNIRSLVEQARTVEQRFDEWLEAAEQLTPYVSAYRYPHEDDEPSEPTREQFTEALNATEQLYAFVLELLPVETHPTPPQQEIMDGAPNATS